MTILHGDSLEMLKTIPSNTVDCCITSPPYYALRDYGVDGQIGLEETPEEYVQKLVAVFREVKRVLKDDGIFVFVSPGPNHLKELKEVLYKTTYENETEQRFHTLKMDQEHLISAPFAVEHDNLLNLFMMTPYYYHTGSEGKKKLEDIASISITAEFLVRTYRKQL